MKKALTIAISLFAFAAVGLAQQPQQNKPDEASKINLTMEQRHVIRESLKELKIERASAAPELAIGDAIPKTIELHAMPAEIFNRISQVKNHAFFLKGNQIILVDTKDSTVADIIE